MREFEKKEIKVLLRLLSKTLFDANTEIDFSGVDLATLYKESRYQTVVGLAFDALPSSASNLDANIYAEWRLFAIHIMQQNLRLLSADTMLHKILKNHNVPHCTIKGTASASYYPNPSLRQMGDVDLLLSRRHINKAVALLLKNGFEATENDTIFHKSLTKNGVVYEVHHDQAPLQISRRFFKGVTKKTIESAIEYNTELGTVLIPDHFNHGLSMLLHIYRHLEVCDGIGLRHLCDWAVFANAIDEKEFSDLFEKPLKKYGLWKFCKVLSWAAHLYLGMPEKKWFGEIQKNLADNLMQEILYWGNFGRKNPVPTNSSLFIVEDAKNRKGLSKQLYILKRRVWRWNRFYKNHRLLYPVGLLFYSVRLLWQLIFKGKKLDFSTVNEKTSDFASLFSEMEFFKPEK